MVETGHLVPQRTCIGCRGVADRSQLLRVVAATDHESGSVRVVVDARTTLPGRGAWLHPHRSCLEYAVKRRAFGRALRLDAAADLSPLTEWFESHDLRVARSDTANDRPATESGFDADEHPMSTQQ